MNKRILKRHKRQVSRAKDRVRLSEPDLRTPEQLTAAREVSRSCSQPAQPPPRALRHAVPPESGRPRRNSARKPHEE